MSNYSHMYNWVLGPSRVLAQLGLKAMGLASGKMHYKSNILSSKYPTVLQKKLGVHKWGYGDGVSDNENNRNVPKHFMRPIFRNF